MLVKVYRRAASLLRVERNGGELLQRSASERRPSTGRRARASESPSDGHRNHLPAAMARGGEPKKSRLVFARHR